MNTWQWLCAAAEFAAAWWVTDRLTFTGVMKTCTVKPHTTGYGGYMAGPKPAGDPPIPARYSTNNVVDHMLVDTLKRKRQEYWAKAKQLAEQAQQQKRFLTTQEQWQLDCYIKNLHEIERMIRERTQLIETMCQQETRLTALESTQFVDWGESETVKH